MLLLIPAFSSAAAAATARDQKIRVVAVNGDVKVTAPDLPLFRSARLGEALSPGSRIRANKGGSAIIELATGNRIFISEYGDVAIDTAKIVTSSGANKPHFYFVLRQREGTIVPVLRKLPKGSKIQIRTPVSVIGVRGTVFSSRVMGSGATSGARVAVTEGEVEVRASGFTKPIKLTAGQSVGCGGVPNPGRIETIPPTEKKAIDDLAAAAVKPATPTEKCVDGIKVHNGTATDISVTIAASGVYMAQRVPAKSEKMIRFKASDCVTVSSSNRAVSAVGGAAGGATSVDAYADRLKARDKPGQTASSGSASGGHQPPDAAAVAGDVAFGSRASYEEEKAREAAERAAASQVASSSGEGATACIHGYPLGECCNVSPSSGGSSTKSASSGGPTSRPVTKIPTVTGVGYSPVGTEIQTETGPKFSARKQICGGITKPVVIADDVTATPHEGPCEEPEEEDWGEADEEDVGIEDDEDGHGEDDEDGSEEDPRDTWFDEELWNELLDAWRRMKEEEDRRLRDELEKLEKEMEEKKEKIDKERERRRRHPERERNQQERERLDKERNRLDEEKDKIEEERDRIQGDEDRDNQLDKDLREAEDEIKRNDPNCRSAECRQIREERTKLQQRRVDRMKAGQANEKRAQKFDRDNRAWNKDRNDLEERLDSGEGLTRDEHRARMEVKRAEAARAEYTEYNRRYFDLHGRVQRGEVSQEEYDEYKKLERNLESLRDQAERFERSAVDQINKTIEAQGGMMGSYGRFVEEAETHRDKLAPGGGWKKDPPLRMKPGYDFDGFSGDELDQRSRRLGGAIDRVQDARTRIGQGGPQPGDANAGTRNFEKEKAEIEQRMRDLENANNRIRSAGIDAYGQPAAGNPGARGRVTQAQVELDRAKQEGKPYSEIQRLEQNLRDAERGFRAAERALRSAERGAQGIADNLNNRIDNFNEESRFEAMAENAHNMVNAYNGSFGDVVDRSGQLDPDALRDRINSFERNAGRAQGEHARIGALEEMKRNLRAAPAGGGEVEGRRLGLSDEDIRRHEETLNRQILRAQERRDEAIQELRKNGFDAQVGGNGKIQVASAPGWARVFGQATQRVIEERAKAAEEPDREGPRDRGPPPIERAEVVTVSPESEDAARAVRMAAMERRMAQAEERRQAALEGGMERWREVTDRQRRDELVELKKSESADERTRARIASLEGELEKSEKSRAAEAERERRQTALWVKWGEEIVADRRWQEQRAREERERLAREKIEAVRAAGATGQEAVKPAPPSQRETERGARLEDAAAALTGLRENHDVEKLRERLNRLERDFMEVQADRAHFEREGTERDLPKLERLADQYARTMAQIEAYRIALQRAHEHRTEARFEEDRRRAYERMAEWAQVRSAVPPSPEQAAERPPVRVAQVAPEGGRQTPGAPAGASGTTTRPPVAPSAPEPSRAPQPVRPERPAPEGGREPGPTSTPTTTARDTKTATPATPPVAPVRPERPRPEGAGEGTRERPGVTGDTRAAREGIERPRVSVADDEPDSRRARRISDSLAASASARAYFEEWARRTLGGILQRNDPALEMLSPIIMRFADEFGAENASKMLVDALSRLRDRRTIRGVDILNALFEQSAVEAERKGGVEARRAAQLGHLQLLDMLLRENQIGAAFGLNDALKQSLRDRISRMASALADQFGEEARGAERAGNSLQEIRHLATLMQLANFRGAGADERNPILRRIAALQEKLLREAEAGFESPRDVIGAASGIADSLRNALLRLPENALEDEKAALLEELARSHRLRRLGAQQFGRQNPVGAALARPIELDATVAEARVLAGLNRLSDAAALLRGLEPRNADEFSMRAQALAPLLALAERAHIFLTEDQRGALGSLEELRKERKGLLETWMRAETDRATVAAIALERVGIARDENNLEDALRVLEDGLRKAPDDPILLGVKLQVELARAGPERAAAAQRLVEAIPPERREAALAVALNSIGALGDLEGIVAIEALLGRPEFAEMRPRLGVRVGLAKLEAIGRTSPNETLDNLADRLIRDGLAAVENAGFDEETKRTIRAALDEARSGRAAVNALIEASRGERPPPGGWSGLARQAFAAGRLDVAERAILKELTRLDNEADRETLARGYAEAIGMINLIRARAEDPRLTREQREYARGFVDRMGQEVVRRMDVEIERQMPGVARQARTVYEQREQPERTRNATKDRYVVAVDSLRALERLRATARVATLDEAARAGDLAQKLGELNRAITDLQNEIRTEFAGMKKEIERPENRARLEERLGALDALRARRDGVTDLINARSGRTVIEGFIRYDRVSKSATDWELHRLEEDLNGTTIYDQPTYGARGRWRGASGWRKFTELAGEDNDRQRDLFMLENEIQYLERRRFQLVMEDPALSTEQKRAKYEEVLRREAARWQREGESVSPLLFPELSGLGKAEIALAQAQVRAIEQMRLRNMEVDFSEAKKRGDPQAAYEALVRLREASLAGEIDRYVDYLSLPWYRRGPIRGVRIGLWSEEAGRAIEEMSADVSRLHAILIRAAHRPVNQLTAEDRAFLEERGFVVNGRYAIPDGIELKPKTAATPFVTEGATAQTIDRYVNAAFAAELAATVVIPGAVSARLAGAAFSRVALTELVRREGLAVTARYLTTGLGARYLTQLGAERALEAAFFTALSRGARTVLSPEMILDERAWTFSGIGQEYLHNLAVIGTLRGGAGAMGLASEGLRRALGRRLEGAAAEALFRVTAGAATALGEAGILTGMHRLLEGNKITSQDFIGNLLTVGMLRAMHVGRGGGEPGEVGQIARALENYNRWLDAELIPARRLMNQFNGNWDALRGAYQRGQITENQMRQVFELRKRVIDELAREIVDELGGDVKSFGSSNLTSDYDLSFSGRNAEAAVEMFNQRFNARWSRALELGGAESATRLDVNFYTNPIFDAFKGGRDDVFHQDLFAHMAGRKYMNDAQWREYRQRVLDATPEANRARLREALDRIERSVAGADRDIAALEAQLRREAGVDDPMRAGVIDQSNFGWAARNRLYERQLREIIRLKEAYDKAGTDAQRAEIAQQLRDAQSTALYFAAEAYQTDAAIKHVVFTIQAAGRRISVESLMGRERPQTNIPLTEAQGRQSYFEQMANLYKEFNHHGNEFKLAGKTAKYFVRALDAARIGGIEFTPEMRRLIEETVHIDSIRGDAAAVEAYLKSRYPDSSNPGEAYMNGVKGLLNTLAGQLASRT